MPFMVLRVFEDLSLGRSVFAEIQTRNHPVQPFAPEAAEPFAFPEPFYQIRADEHAAQHMLFSEFHLGIAATSAPRARHRSRRRRSRYSSPRRYMCRNRTQCTWNCRCWALKIGRERCCRSCACSHHSWYSRRKAPARCCQPYDRLHRNWYSRRKSPARCCRSSSRSRRNAYSRRKSPARRCRSSSRSRRNAYSRRQRDWVRFDRFSFLGVVGCVSAEHVWLRPAGTLALFAVIRVSA